MIAGARRIKDLIRNRAKGNSTKSQMLLRHYSMERLLERLSVSNYSNDFIIKGGMLVSSLIGVDERTTRDIDATMRGHSMDLSNVTRILNEVIDLLTGSKMMERHWGKYQAANPFAASISWLEVLASLRETINAIKDAKTTKKC